jgi:hypothetical protein
LVAWGFDPGLTGAIAAHCELRGMLEVADLPTCSNGLKTGKMKRWIDDLELCHILRDWSERHEFRFDFVEAVIERPIAMPGQQITTAASNYDTLGVIRGILTSKDICYRLITPREWKTYYGIGKDKADSLQLAREYYPDAPLHLKKHHNRAEAILIGRYEMENQD